MIAKRFSAAWFLGIGISFLAPTAALAHCDSLDGPVVKAAHQALETKNPDVVLVWVRPEDEPEVRVAFEKALAVRLLSEQARDLADRFFFETVVRVHRTGEGAPYTGLKPAGADFGPAIAAADKAIDLRSPEPILEPMMRALEMSLRWHFDEVIALKSHQAGDLRAGRAHIRAYVEFVHYVERLYEAISTPAQGHFIEPKK